MHWSTHDEMATNYYKDEQCKRKTTTEPFYYLMAKRAKQQPQPSELRARFKRHNWSLIRENRLFDYWESPIGKNRFQRKFTRCLIKKRSMKQPFALCEKKLLLASDRLNIVFSLFVWKCFACMLWERAHNIMSSPFGHTQQLNRCLESKWSSRKKMCSVWNTSKYGLVCVHATVWTLFLFHSRVRIDSLY